MGMRLCSLDSSNKNFVSVYRKLFIIIFFILVMSGFNAIQVHAMSKIGFKICLATESEGVVTSDGIPLDGAEVERVVENKGKKHIDHSVTDSDGRFSFPSLYTRALTKFLPIQPVVSQEVTITYKGEKHIAWGLTKMNWDENGELNSFKALQRNNILPFDVICELSDEDKSMQLEESLQIIYGKCNIVGQKILSRSK